MRRSRNKIDRSWPSWRYSPSGEGKIFQSEAEVPIGWTKKPGEVYVPTAGPLRLNKDELISQLKAKGIDINPIWGSAQLKKVLDGSSTTR
jgi:hypothetical protein